MSPDPRSNIKALKVDYTAGDLDSEAKIIAAVNATNAKINEIIQMLIDRAMIVGP
jgi:hypothetical protein